MRARCTTAARRLGTAGHLAPETVAATERLRRERLTGPAISRQLGVPRSTVGAVLRRIGLGCLAALDPLGTSTA